MKIYDMDLKRYSYKELRAAAVAAAATQDAINGAINGAIDALGEWMTTYGTAYWNGECFDIDDGLGLWPVYGEPNEDGDVELIRYEIR